jgi:hypothetical protein
MEGTQIIQVNLLPIGKQTLVVLRKFSVQYPRRRTFALHVRAHSILYIGAWRIKKWRSVQAEWRSFALVLFALTKIATSPFVKRHVLPAIERHLSFVSLVNKGVSVAVGRKHSGFRKSNRRSVLFFYGTIDCIVP